MWAWFAVLGVILLMLAVDQVAHRRAHVIGVREVAVWSIVWVTLGVAFGVLVWTLTTSTPRNPAFSRCFVGSCR